MIFHDKVAPLSGGVYFTFFGLLQIMCLRLLQKHGHRPIVLLGGGTTRIGDPSGKDKTRTILDEKEIEKNIKNIEKILKNFLDTKDSKTKPIFVNNYSWLKDLNYISFLRDIGKHFTINKMLSFDSVKTRLEREQSLSYMEFNYMILQAYDFLELNKKENCALQIGGSDQWGNIVNGVELIRKINQKESFGLTTPLITLSSGAKMGKTEDGAIWLENYCKETFGNEYKVHTAENVYAYIHIDTTFVFLREGLVMLNPSRVNWTNCPQMLNDFDKIWAPEPYATQVMEDWCPASPWLGMNILPINDRLCMVEENQALLMRELKKWGIESIPVKMRHARTFSGGPHCVTLDVVRDDN